MAPRRDIFGAMLGRVFQKWVALSMSPSLGGLRGRARSPSCIPFPVSAILSI